MYQPEHYRVEDVAQMHALMRARPFATLISCGSSGLYATHLPTVLKDESAYGVIECHLARANPHWKDLAAATEALMIFQGPEGYITPNWYPSKTAHGKVVPTWNYSAVHLSGTVRVHEDRNWLRDVVTRLTGVHEDARSEPWHVSDAPERYIDGQLGGIVGLEITVTRVEGKAKLSQNRDMQDRDGVAKGLGRRGDGGDLEMAEIVSRYIVPSD